MIHSGDITQSGSDPVAARASGPAATGLGVPMELALEEPPLRIRFAQGSGDTLVVCFSGIGADLTVEPELEMVRTATKGGTRPTVFVTDHARSWFNHPGMAKRVADVVMTAAEHTGATRIVAVGNSMGGTMALHLARLVPLAAVVAIVPQYSVKPDVMPDETRWLEQRVAITDWSFPVVESVPEETLAIILHGTGPGELRHMRRFPRSRRMKHFVFPGQGHDLARTLNKSGVLAQIVDRAFAGEPYRTRRAMQAAGGITRTVFDRTAKSRS